MKHYQKCDINNGGGADNNLSICLNSLHKLKIDIDDIKNYVVYIDEVASFLEFSHNDTLDNNIQAINISLMRIMKYAKKVIVSDALINDNVITFLKQRRKQDLTTLYINNTFKKYEGVKAYRIRDEDKLLNQLLSNIEKQDYFLFGCDSNDTITKLYNHCLNKATAEARDKFILITADTDYEIHDANEQFKNKYVFYSPKITFGIDFTYEIPQDVFIYVKGRSINP